MKIHSILTAMLCGVSAVASADTISYVADGASGEYCGVGYKVSVSVSKPTSGYVIQYAESAAGPWSDDLGYKDVCTDKPMYFKISAAGYATVTGSANVTVTPKTLTEDYVWGVYPAEAYVYDGTAKTPDAACGDGEPSIITTDDFTVTYENNVNAGEDTAKIVFTGKNNYAGVVEESFSIAKADNAWTTQPSLANWTYGQTPSEPVSAAKVGTATVTYSSGAKPTLPGDYTATFTVAASQNYNALTANVPFKVLPATISYVADGASGVYCGTGYGISVSVSKPSSGATVKYAASAEGPWSETPVTYKDVCTDKPVYFQISATGYATVTGSANVTVTPKTLTEDYVWGVYPAEAYVYDGTAKTPDAACGDGEPSIITTDDFTVTYENNVNAGEDTAKIVFTGKNNYAGVVEEYFSIAKADNAWTTQPSLANWTYGQTPSEPVSAAKVGTATVTYSSGAKPTLPGDYTATFTVAASQNYNELTADVPFKVLPATIAYVADGSSGVYCGTGYGISVSVSMPASGATVKYSDSAEGPWSETPVAYKNVCTDKPVYFQILATGYTTATGSANVTVTPKTLTEDYVWGVYPAEAYVYDGTAKTPDAACGDGEPSIITADDFTVSYENNVNAGEDTAKIVFTGKNNYAGTVEETFSIAKAKAWDGEEPGPGIVPLGGKSKFDNTVEYDGQPHTINTNTLRAVKKEGFTLTFSYALTWDGAYQPDPFEYVDVVTTSFWYKICLNNPNYEDYLHEARLAITPRDIDKATIAPIADIPFAGVPVTPVPTVTDGEPSIITEADYTVSYLDNDKPGVATVTLTGKGNYTGVKSENFMITPGAAQHAALTGALVWKLNLGSGCYTAQLNLTCTNGLAQGISDLRFVYQDRKDGETMVSALYDSSKRAYRPTVNYSGTTYRYVNLDATRISAENEEVLYGVKDVAQSRGVIARNECLIELYVRSLSTPVSDLGYVVWTSNGKQCGLPITAAGEPQGMVVKDTLEAVRLATAAPRISLPLSTTALNTSMALGVVVDPASSPYCKLAAFSADASAICGRVEVGKACADGVQTRGTLGANAQVVLKGARSLDGGFEDVGRMSVGEDGTFRFAQDGRNYKFFKVAISIENVVE